jgi:hypothetical protein
LTSPFSVVVAGIDTPSNSSLVDSGDAIDCAAGFLFSRNVSKALVVSGFFFVSGKLCDWVLK